MNDSVLSPRPAPTYPLVAWVVIVAAVVFTVWNQQRRGEQTRAGGDEVALVLEGRVLVALKELGRADKPPEKELARLAAGTYRQRLLVAILIAELQGDAEAADYLTRLDDLQTEQAKEPTPSEARLRAALGRLYGPEPVELLTDEQREVLDQHGWLGRLALAYAPDADPADLAAVRAEAVRGTLAVGGMIAFGLALAVVGSFLLVLFVALWYLGRLRWASAPGPGGGLYAEAFAVWFVAYLGLSWLVARVPGLGTLGGTGVVALASVLLALLWPRLRGRDWATIRADVGLTRGESVGSELLAGLATYAACLPLLLTTAFLATWASGRLLEASPPVDPFAPSSRPSHPAAATLLHGDLWDVVVLYWAAVVVAPLAEELAFRGFLQRHLRGFLGRLASATGVALVFAIIHPQGPLGVPVLVALAVPFSLAREWRGSLIAPMTAHALNNAAVTTLLVLALR